MIAQHIGPAGAAGSRRPPHATAMNKPGVLLVDDDRSVLGTVIESEGFEVVRAVDGHEAVGKFRINPPTLCCSI